MVLGEIEEMLKPRDASVLYNNDQAYFMLNSLRAYQQQQDQHEEFDKCSNTNCTLLRKYMSNENFKDHYNFFMPTFEENYLVLENLA